MTKKHLNPDSQTDLGDTEKVELEDTDTVDIPTEGDLSPSKMRFIWEGDFSSYQLKAADLRPITRHYKQKNHIQIVINGEHPFGQELISKKLAAMDEQIKGLNDDSLKYALYIQKHWLQPGYLGDQFCISNMFGSDFSKVYKELKQLLAPYLTNDGEIKKGLSTQELLDLNEIVKAKFAALFDAKITRYIAFLDESKSDVCLDKQEVIDEIKKIQSGLKPGQLAGYVYTNNRRVGESHFEVVIIGPETIIKPVHWGNQGRESGLYSEDLTGMFDTKIDSFVQTTSAIPLPQAGHEECGTLGIMYLNELLKDNAKQLQEDSLRFSFYDKGNSLAHFFFPSPQVLRFSQSSAYNSVIKAMLEDAPDVEVIHGNKKYRVKTLRGILEESIEAAKKCGNSELAARNQKILDDLPSFRKHWLQSYDLCEQKRSLMEDRHNLYLAYTTQRMRRKADEHAGLQVDFELENPPLLPETHAETETETETEIEATNPTSDEVMQSSTNGEHSFTPQQSTIIIEAMQKALTSMGTSRFVSGRDDKEKLLVQFKSAFENATNGQERHEALRNFVTAASTPRQGVLNFFPAAYGKTRSATAFYEHIKNQDPSLVEVLKTMDGEKGIKVVAQSNSSEETTATMPADQARGIMQHFKRAIQVERGSELKTGNDSVDSQNLCDTGLKI
ncbi:TPA: hypothetical protein RG395_002861 [Legionella pneumophila]|uniref:hypothetical protein n=1 Tax=Legionella pneumophila TaxID=446 RepID=UPI000788326D|nr:hypothetical protein [Legionella pneumophila]HAT3977269.1 hypothetical protein [Legionella pneumophila]HAT8358021.1 hypothetical protein [Legionella pneumophila]HAU1208221.1 hypothetical protein [Legionella pneumophila]HAU1284541.1 hypothetical protein [Legionella pneumophila]HAU1961224.1 hypothetical protein [Legionella pneumophila]